MEPKPVTLAAECNPSKTVKSATNNKTSGTVVIMVAGELDWQAQAHSLACVTPPVW